MTGSIGADIAGVDAEARHLRADLESAKARAEDAITQLQQRLIDLKAELQVTQEELAHMHAPGPLVCWLRRMRP